MYPLPAPTRNPLYGKYRAMCMDIHDPVAKGRIRVQCPTVFGEQWSDWCSPCMPAGSFMFPAEGDMVWIEFEGGNPAYPIWVGVWYNGLNEDNGHAPWQEFHSSPWVDKGGNVIDKAKIDHRKEETPDKVEQEFFQHSYYDPHTMGFKLPSGASVRFSEEPGKEFYEIITSPMRDHDGKASIMRITPEELLLHHTGLKCLIKFDSDGIHIEAEESNVYIEGVEIHWSDKR